MLSFQGYVDAAPDLDPEPGVMTFAFGKRAYYLFWKCGGNGWRGSRNGALGRTALRRPDLSGARRCTR
jgi:hypothetical protein